MSSTRNSVGSADVRESSFVNLEDNCVRIADSKSIVVKSDICHFIYNTVSQSNRWGLPIVIYVTTTAISRGINCLCVKINDG